MDYFLFNFSGVQFHYTMRQLFLIKVIVTDKNIEIILDADKITNMVMGQ
jgi:hypothetical protein